MKFFLAAVAALLIVFLVLRYVNRKYSFKGMRYSAYFSSSEVYAGDYVYLYEEISNEGKLPVSYMKADTELPEGLDFVFLGEEKEQKKPEAASRPSGKALQRMALSEKRKVVFVHNLQSLFVLKPGMKIRRRWRIYCKTRGEYALNGVLLTMGDLLGYDFQSKRIAPDEHHRTTVTVLPVPQVLAENFTSSRFLCGDLVSRLCPVTDPVRICGSREYTPVDPMNKINWKSTAVHGKLMVNIEEKTVRYRFSVILNMNSREIEHRPDVPSDKAAIEKSIIACASVLDRIAAENMPVKLYVNSPADENVGLKSLCADGDGALVSCTEPFRGKRDMVFALRTLAKIPMKISLPAESFFDHIAANPDLYCDNENLVIISSYLDARMVNLSKIMQQKGVKLSFYVTTSRNLLGYVPEDLDVWFPVIE